MMIENPLDAYTFSANDTVSVNRSYENDFILIASCENNKPESLTNDIFCKELS